MRIKQFTYLHTREERNGKKLFVVILGFWDQIHNKIKNGG